MHRAFFSLWQYKIFRRQMTLRDMNLILAALLASCWDNIIPPKMAIKFSTGWSSDLIEMFSPTILHLTVSFTVLWCQQREVLVRVRQCSMRKFQERMICRCLVFALHVHVVVIAAGSTAPALGHTTTGAGHTASIWTTFLMRWSRGWGAGGNVSQVPLLVAPGSCQVSGAAAKYRIDYKIIESKYILEPVDTNGNLKHSSLLKLKLVSLQFFMNPF